uniref:DHC_N1 domain-containing protein n=1 Tax=Steinernema glaseri TaxID=37863 RepID=A0A1I7Z1D8_9BILA
MIRRLGQATYGRIGEESPELYGKIQKAPSSAVSSPSPLRADSRATSSNASTQQSSQPDSQKNQLTAFISHLCGQLRKVVIFVNDIAIDTAQDRRHPSDLLHDLEAKVLPFLMQIDEEMTEMGRLIRAGIDSCNIADPDVDWLLAFNKYHQEMQRVWHSLSTGVFADLESVLDVRRRGVLGVLPKPETLEDLAAMRAGMDRAMSLIMKESEC